MNNATINTNSFFINSSPINNECQNIKFSEKILKTSPLVSRENDKHTLALSTNKTSLNSDIIGTKEHSEKFKNNANKTSLRYFRKHISGYALAHNNTNEKLVTTGKSLCSCGCAPHFNNENKEIIVKETDIGKRHLSGVKTCGSAWVCPTCSSKLSYVRGNTLKEMLEIGRENNRTYILTVLTVPHYADDSLNFLMEMLDSTYNYVYNSRKWKKFKKDFGLKFVHSGLEVMASFKKGENEIDWHPHKNLLLDFDLNLEKLKEKVKEELGFDGELQDWQLQLYIANFIYQIANPYILKNYNRTLKEPFLQQRSKNTFIIKGGISCTLDFEDKYAAKWGLDAELTAGSYKKGKAGESFHPFYLLDFINEATNLKDDIYKEKCINAFQEYALITKGKSFFRFAKNSKEFYNLDIKSDVEEIENLDKAGETLLTISENDFTLFKPSHKKIGKLLILQNVAFMVAFLSEEIEYNKNNFDFDDDTEVEAPSKKLLGFDNGIFLKDDELPF